MVKLVSRKQAATTARQANPLVRLRLFLVPIQLHLHGAFNVVVFYPDFAGEFMFFIC